MYNCLYVDQKKTNMSYTCPQHAFILFTVLVDICGINVHIIRQTERKT